MRHHCNAAASLATRFAGPVQSGGRERTGAGADSSAWKGRRRSGDDASAGGLGSICLLYTSRAKDEAEEKDAIATVNKQEDANFSNNAMAEAFKAAKGE